MRYFVSAMLFVFLLAPPAALTAAESENDESFTLQSQRQVGQIDRVNIVLEASGDVLAKTASGDATERVAVSVSARRDYDEKMLSVGDASDKALRSVRYYNEAAANVKRGTSEQKPTLRDDRRLIGVEIVGGKATPFSPQGTLDIDELELVTAAGESLPVDQILPATPMKIGQKWKVANDTVALLLGLEQVTANSVEVVLKEVAPDVARMELEGQVEGKLYGAANQVSLKAKCRFDRRNCVG